MTEAAAFDVRFGHLGLNCIDMEVTEAFYRRVFGFRRLQEVQLAETRLVFIGSGDLTFELFEAQGVPGDQAEGSGPTAPGYRHLALAVPDVAQLLASRVEALEITQGPMDLSAHGLSSSIVWLRDPDGRIIELYQS